MKKILICIQFLLLTTVAYATGQDSDAIYINVSSTKYKCLKIW